ncbi:MAG: protein kinase [Candidatus Obscuribacterales bacterium]|nr:protein kinase [Candidatus Obscuribacterales bacterium]
MKPKKSGASGSLTQWMSVCRCDIEVGCQEQGESLNICFTCGKPIEAGRSGSFTQWIFRPESCSCAFPERAALSPGSDSAEAQYPVEVAVEQTYLELDPGEFPSERYKPVRKLGAGMTGSVYLCQDILLGKKVAVKTLNSVEASQLVTFQREAKITSQLDHPGIVKIFDFGITSGGVPFMVMEYVDGESLSQYLHSKGRFDQVEAQAVIVAVLNALETAHSAGVYHRDLKPGNILVFESEAGIISKLIDFGIAHVQFDDQEPTVFQGRKIVGTPAYMSPDQVVGGVYDARSEIYSIGCIYFELLTGRQPFAGDNSMEVLLKHMNEAPPSVSEYLQSSDQSGSDTVIARCMDKDPQERFQTVTELANFLEKTAVDVDGRPDLQNAEDIEKPGRSRGLILAISILLIGAATLATVQFASRHGPDREPIKDTQIKVSKSSSKAKKKDRDGDFLASSDKTNPKATKDSSISGPLIFTGRTAAASFHKEVAEHPEKMYIDVVLQDANLKDSDMKKITETDRQALLLSGNPDLTDKSLEMISKVTTLDRLELEDSPLFTPKGILSLKNMPRLGYISFRNCQLEDEDLKALAPLSSLFKLILSLNPKITEQGLENLGRRETTLTVVAEGCACAKASPKAVQRLYSLYNIKLEAVDEGDIDLKSITEEFMAE